MKENAAQRGSAIRGVAVIGGGPAGSALGIHLARKGIKVAVFDPGRRPSLVVGESLVPALIPLLQELGIESEVASVSTYKPGATFFTSPEQEFSFFFANAGRNCPTYSYNVPRDAFDSIVKCAAARSGTVIIDQRAGLCVGDATDSVSLDEKTLHVWRERMGTERPDLIVDASGRSRTLAKLLQLQSWEGLRKDVALFAHLRAIKITHEGHIHINRLKRGWSWRIPLPGRVSLGIVIPQEALGAYGSSAEEQYERLCAEEPILRSYIEDNTRLTPVMKYSNYQLASDNWAGRSWALLGDAGGFIDPIFSSGLLLALEGASELAKAILAGWGTNDARRYEMTMAKKLAAWRSLIDSFYDGRMFSLFRLRRLYGGSRFFTYVVRCVDQQLALALSGVAPTSKLRLWLLNGLLAHLQSSKSPHRLKIA